MNHDWRLKGAPAIFIKDSEVHVCKNCSTFRYTYSKYDLRGLTDEEILVSKYAYRIGFDGTHGNWKFSYITCLEMQMENVLG